MWYLELPIKHEKSGSKHQILKREKPLFKYASTKTKWVKLGIYFFEKQKDQWVKKNKNFQKQQGKSKEKPKVKTK